jgi:hypothetical protein
VKGGCQSFQLSSDLEPEAIRSEVVGEGYSQISGLLHLLDLSSVTCEEGRRKASVGVRDSEGGALVGIEAEAGFAQRLLHEEE